MNRTDLKIQKPKTQFLQFLFSKKLTLDGFSRFLNKLHWLRAREQITFKLCLLVYKAINGHAPSYLQDLCVPVTTVSTRVALHSAARGDLVVPRTRHVSATGHFVSPVPQRGTACRQTFQLLLLRQLSRILKNHLFIQSYYTT